MRLLEKVDRYNLQACVPEAALAALQAPLAQRLRGV